MARPLTPANRSAGDVQNDRLHDLVTRIAAGDRAAFRIMYAYLVMRVWRDAIRLLPPVDARAATRSTFVEIWHLAGHHLDHDGRQTCAWILSITARHVEERTRSTGAQSLHCDGYDHHTHRELIALLGSADHFQDQTPIAADLQPEWRHGGGTSGPLTGRSPR